MKRIRTIITGIIAVIITFTAMPMLSAQTLTPEIKQKVTTELRKQLPMEVATGMMWTNITLNAAGTAMDWTFTINPTKMGTTLAEAKSELKATSAQEFKALLGKEFDEIFKLLDCNLNIILVFPDKSEVKYLLKKGS